MDENTPKSQPPPSLEDTQPGKTINPLPQAFWRWWGAAVVSLWLYLGLLLMLWKLGMAKQGEET